MHHHFQSKYLIDSLNALGYSSSYKEVLRFGRNAAMISGAQLENCIGEKNEFKFVADNVDHNVCTLNGENTFHGMSMVAAITNAQFLSRQTPRKTIAETDFINKSDVEIVRYKEAKQILKTFNCKQLPSIKSSSNRTDLLWKLSRHFKNPIPNWSGCMQLIHEKQNREEFKTDNVTFLPMIDLSASDMSCIFSTLSFISTLAYKPAIVTFDQPLFWKGKKIVIEANDPLVRQIIVMLGTFHTIMNLLGCIGYLMANTGLSDISEDIYGECTVNQMLIGKAYSRALRGHLIVDQVLSNIIFERAMQIHGLNINDETERLEKLYDGVVASDINLDDLECNDPIKAIDSKIEETKLILKRESRTSKL